MEQKKAFSKSFRQSVEEQTMESDVGSKGILELFTLLMEQLEEEDH